jgi:hypothetical protein
MDERGWKYLSLVVSIFCFVLLIFLVLFGYRLASYNKVKAQEISNNLKKQENQLKKDFQTEKETAIASYRSEDLFGNFYFEYPKVWFTNALQEQGGTPEFQFMGDPSLIMIRGDAYTRVALRVQVFATPYQQKLDEIRGENNTDTTKLKETEIKITGLKGIKFTGRTEQVKDKNVSFCVFPLRDKSIVIGTDDIDTFSKQYQNVLDSFRLSK